MSHRYLARTADLAGSDEEVLHLIRANAEASLCGLPAKSLSANANVGTGLVCVDCIYWLCRCESSAADGSAV